MIANKIRRQAPSARQNRAELAYMSRLSRYIVRADAEDLRKLARISDDQYLSDLARYAVAEGRAEVAIASGSRNLLGNNLDEWQAEMGALLHRCPNSANALDHWVLSWQEGEEPAVAEIERAVEIFVRCQGLFRCPSVWGYHGDTDNRHVHLAILKIDPKTGERQAAGDGWDIDAGHRAKAVIEDAFPHWRREEGSRYEVIESMLVNRLDGTTVGPADKPELWSRFKRDTSNGAGSAKDITSRLDPESRAYEDATGFKSRKRVALEVAVPIALRAKSWNDLHSALAKEGIFLERVRTGAVFIIDGKPVSASIDRSTSLKKLEARYGSPFAASSNPALNTARREMWPNDLDRRRYYAAKRAHNQALATAVSGVRRALGRGGGEPASAALEAARHAAAFPSYSEWQNGGQPADPAATVAAAMELAVLSVPRDPATVRLAETVQGFRATHLAGRVIYRNINEPRGRPAFVDVGNEIFVNATRDREAVRASLLLIAKRFPKNGIAVAGDRAFCELVLDVAEEEGVRLGGALGRRQHKRARQRDHGGTASDTRRFPRAILAPAKNEVRREAAAADIPRAANPTQTEIGSEAGRPILATIARVFFTDAWEPRDYRKAGKSQELAFQSHVAEQSRTTVDIPALPGTRSSMHDPVAVRERARQAAAASISR